MSNYGKTRQAPLSNIQKARIGMLAREAWEAWSGRAEFLAANDDLSPSACFTAWRRVEQGKAIRKQSLRAATQEDYLHLRAHFLNIKGAGGRALKAKLRAAEEPRIVAFYKLKKALDERDLSESYAAAICRRQYRCSLSEASEKQLWNLFYTVRNRRKAVRKSSGPRYIHESLGDLSDRPF